MADYQLINGTDMAENLDNNSSNHVTISAGAGNDSILNQGDYNLILGGDGDDTISNKNSIKVTYVTNYKTVTEPYEVTERVPYTYYVTKYRDVYRYGAGGTRIKSVEQYQEPETRYNTVTKTYTRTVTKEVKEAVNTPVTHVGSTINGGAGDDRIINEASQVVYQYALGDGNDVIYGYSANDTLNITSGSYDKQLSGGDTIIKVGTGSVTLKEYTGTVNIVGNQATTTDTTPPDTTPADTTPADTTPADTTPAGTQGVYLTNNNDNSLVSGTDNDDTIYNYSSNIYLQGKAGRDYIIGLSGENITLLGGAGDDTIKHWSKKSLMDGGAGNDTLYSGEERSTVIGGEGNDSVIVYGKYATVSGGNGNDFIHITNIGGNSTINAGAGDDIVTLDAYSYNNIIQYAANSGYDVVYGYNSTDTIQVPDSNYSTTKSGQDTIINIGNGSLTLKDYTDEVNISAYGVPADTTITDTTPADTTPADTTPVDTTPTDTTPADTTPADTTPADTTPADTTPDDDIITDDTTSGGDDEDDDDSARYVYIDDFEDSTYIADEEVEFIDASEREDEINIIGNDLENDIQCGSGNSTVAGNGGDDYIRGGEGNDSLLGNEGDDELYGEDGNDTLRGGAGKDYLSGGDGNDKLFGDTGNDTLSGGDGKDILNGGAGNDSLLGDAGNDSLNGGAGADTLNGGKGNDTLTGGAGNDVFIYARGNGNDLITDYAVGDKIKITGAKISKTSVSGSNVILTVGTGKVTLKNAVGKKLSIYNNASTLTNTVIGGSASAITSAGKSSTTLTITNSTKSPAIVGSAIKTINASSRTTAVRITGNALANTIRGGSGVDTIYGGRGNDSILGNNGNDKLYGDAGADTLNGGKGNDTLTGGAGVDVFVYATGDGNDVITDYTASDKLRISGTYSTLTSGNDVVVKVGSGRMTLKNAKGKKLNITRATGYEERWFTEDDNNFITSEVSSILKTDNLISTDYKLESELQLKQTADVTSLTYSQSKK